MTKIKTTKGGPSIGAPVGPPAAQSVSESAARTQLLLSLGSIAQKLDVLLQMVIDQESHREEARRATRSG